MNGIGPRGSPEALAMLEQRLRAEPGDYVARHNLAVELRRLDRADEALTAIERAWADGARGPETALMLGHIRADHGEFTAAITAYQAAIVAQPDLIDAQTTLTSLLPQIGRGDEALAGFHAALARAPDTGMLWVAAMAAAKAQRDHLQLLAWADAAEQRFGSDTMVTTFAALALSAMGRDEDARQRLARALALEPDYAAGHATMAHVLLRLGDPAAAAEAALTATRLSPGDQSAWALLGVAWRLLGDPREHWLCDYERLVMPIEIGLPAGLDQALAARHLAHAHPADQSLRGGTQTRGNLFESADPVITALARQIADAVGARLRALPEDAAHPFLRRNTGAVDFVGSWSVRLASEGFHISHIHPAGWLSSALYVSLPDAVTAGRGAGALAFGVPDAALGLDLPARRVVQPREGLLVIFPSYLWHGTTPFADTSPRLTLAFDAVPTNPEVDNGAAQR